MVDVGRWRFVNPLRWVEGVGGFDTVTLVALQWDFVGTYILIHPKINHGQHMYAL